MDVKHRWYLCTYKNVKERFNAMNFARELESVCFDRPCKNGAFNIWNTPNANWIQDSVNGEYCRNGRGDIDGDSFLDTIYKIKVVWPAYGCDPKADWNIQHLILCVIVIAKEQNCFLNLCCETMENFMIAVNLQCCTTFKLPGAPAK